ncbi:MAG TPA: translation elongation factor Ts [Rhabdochlamydiaceae bacterium]|nr:translation elongation factor Ts [Rhabdochlamydiaceae bacterium]
MIQKTVVTAEMVKQLRERTGVGMGKCKEALEQAQGDMEVAIANLRKAGIASAVKKEGREANEGLIGAGESKTAIALVEVNSETDFVTQNEKFRQFLRDVANEAAELKPSNLESFLTKKCTKDPSLTIDAYRALMVQSLGENIRIKRLLVIPKKPDMSIGMYSHMGGKIVAVVELSGGAGHEVLARDIAMHVAAEAPDYLTPEEVPADIKAKEMDIAKSQVQGKPAQMIEKIVQGKLEAFYGLSCLLRQKFVKDNTVNVTQLLERESKAAGKKFQILKYYRWQVGG